MTLNVIGTGFGRTGTDSMRKALNILGVGPTHHMTEVGKDAYLREQWFNLVMGAEPDWDVLFTGYRACVDWPSAYYWRSLVVKYPEAKVLLTTRPAESWWTSFEATILKYILRGDDPNGFAQRLVAEQVFNGHPEDREQAIAIYNRNTEEVISTIASDRLLVHSVEDGWEPLCRWLNLPVPDVDYPHGNTTQDFNHLVNG